MNINIAESDVFKFPQADRINVLRQEMQTLKERKVMLTSDLAKVTLELVEVEKEFSQLLAAMAL